MESPPTCDGVRPARCPGCGAAGRPEGRRRGLVGHGLRERLVLGPRDLGDPPEVSSVLARRYRCRRCGAVVVVVPEGIGRRIAYGLFAIVLALGRWAFDRRPARAVRAEVSPFAIVGASAAIGWSSLGRWARTAERLFPGIPRFDEATRREKARRVLAFVASFAPRTTGALLFDALHGAALAARWTSEA